jgi:hypothetical protein
MDPVLILDEAYAKSRAPEARHSLPAARRIFACLGIRGGEDADFVREAILRYQREKNHLVPDPQYRQNERLFPPKLVRRIRNCTNTFPLRVSVSHYPRMPPSTSDPHALHAETWETKSLPEIACRSRSQAHPRPYP